MTRRFLLFLAAAILLALQPAQAREAQTARTRVLGAGTSWETPWHVRDSGTPGPTVLVTAGVHGDEPAGAYAAEQIRHWPIRRGRLVVLPRANPAALKVGKRFIPGAPKTRRDLNRNFPRAGQDEPARGERARALWGLATALAPDWVVDLHEGFDFHRTNPKSVGNSVIVQPTAKGLSAARLMVGAVDKAVVKEDQRFVLIRVPIDGSFARAAAEHLGAEAMILETVTKQPRSLRARYHRIMVHRLLVHLRMIDPALSVDTLIPADESRTVVGLYDARGAGGSGITKLWNRFRREDGLYIHRIGPPEIHAGALEQFDVLIFPGGMGGSQGGALGAKGRAAVRAFVEDGGGFVGICAGAYLACRWFSWGVGVLDAKTVSPKWRRGRGMLAIELTERGQEILGGEERALKVLYHNGPILAPMGAKDIPDYEPLAWYRDEVAKNGTPKGVQKDSPAIVGAPFGKGRVVVFSPHPEQTKGLEAFVPRAVRWAAGADTR